MHVTGNEPIETIVNPDTGGRFDIHGTSGGLYKIKMPVGGIRPKICETEYTSLYFAKRALQEYFVNRKEDIATSKRNHRDKSREAPALNGSSETE